MEFYLGRVVVIIVLVLVLFQGVNVISAVEFEMEYTGLQVYRDGVVRVNQTLIVNETVPVVNLTLLGSSVDNLIVLDENQTGLDYDINEVNLTIFTLGTSQVSVQYDTLSLTKKEFDVWSLIVDAPYNLTVQLPAEAEIIYLSDMPISIETEDNQITLSLFPRQWEISYIIPLTTPDGSLDNGNGGSPFHVGYLLAVILVVFLSLISALIIVKKRGPNAEKIFKTHPHLRQEDKEVIKFLAEKGGKAFEAEIREEFSSIPRTSLWRLVRRLKKLEIVKIKKIGNENRVELKK